MGFYENHKEAVAGRMAKKLQQGFSQSYIERYLRRCGWDYKETQDIKKRAIQIFERDEK